MERDFWARQTTDKPLFPELEWARPENKMHAGKLLIIGGNLHGFAAPATAFAEAEKAGIGVTRVLLPSAIQKIVGAFIPEAEYGTSTPSGSFASASLSQWLDCGAWSDSILLAGDLGRNSETAIVLEKFLFKTNVPVTITKDALDYLLETPLLSRPDTLVVATTGQLQKLAASVATTTPITSSMDLLRMIDALHELSSAYPAIILTQHADSYMVAAGGQVSTSKLAAPQTIWRTKAAAHAAVWWLQHPQKPFEAITTSVIS